MLLKHRQDGFRGEGSLGVHAAIDSGRVLKDRSGEAATMPKIVIDVGGGLAGRGRNTPRPPCLRPRR
jgi:hypothetical protein